MKEFFFVKIVMILKKDEKKDNGKMKNPLRIMDFFHIYRTVLLERNEETRF